MPGPLISDAALGESDAFLHLVMKRAGRIKGEAVSPNHVDDILLKGWSWGVAASSAIGSTQTTARRSYKALTLSKGVDRASTAMMSALATNDEIKEAKISLRRSGGTQDNYYVIVFERGRIVSLDQSVDGEGNSIETVSFVFNKINVVYRQQQTAGLAGASSTFSDEIFRS